MTFSFPILLATTRGLTLIDYAVVVAYLLGMVVIGVYFSDRQTTTEVYLLGRRNMSPFVVGISLIATLLSTISYLAAPGDMIQHGVAFATGFLAVPLWLTVVLCVWIPFFMRYRLTSIYEYVGLRFNHAARLLAASLFILMRLGWMGLIVYTAGSAVAEMTANLPEQIAARVHVVISPEQWLYIIMLVMGLTTTVYTWLGGIRAVMWGDFAQFIVMLAAVLFSIGYVWLTTGTNPVEWWNQAETQRHGMITWFTTDLTVERTAFLVILDTFFWRLCTHCCDQVATQRYFSTGGIAGALRSNVVSAIGDLALTVLLGLLGLALLNYFSDHARAEAVFGEGFDPSNPAHAALAFPRFIVEYLPTGLAGLVIAALLAAAMSSVSSGINSVSAVVVTDFHHKSGTNSAADRHEGSLARWFSLVTGIAITGVAFLIALVIATDPRNRNIVDLSIRVFNLFLGPLGAMFIAGVFLPFVGSTAVLIATILGVAAAVSLCFAKELFGVDTGPPALLVTSITTTGTVMLAALLGLVLPRPNRDRIAGHTWWTRHLIQAPIATDSSQS